MPKFVLVTLVAMLTAIAAVLAVAEPGALGHQPATGAGADSLTGRGSVDGPLLVFLGGTGNTPERYRSFLDEAERARFHVIGLDYSNRGRSVSDTCRGDADCWGLLQGNRFDGRTPSAFSAVDPAHGVRARLIRALMSLEASDPDGGWGGFLAGSGPGTSDRDVVWRRVVLAGHSQGAGIAAFIAHEHRVGAVLTFGGPILTDGERPASWLHEPGSTPTPLLYAFASSADKYFDRIADSWRLLGIPGTELVRDVPVPTATELVDGVHRFVTTFRLGGPSPSHGRVVNELTPRDPSGRPVFAPVWRSMLESAASHVE